MGKGEKAIFALLSFFSSLRYNLIRAAREASDLKRSLYLRHWEIECLFSCLKGRGFCFEETHLTNRARIKKMMVLLAIGFCWAHKTGESRTSIKPIRCCKHRDSRRPQNSYMRYGLDYIREIIINPFPFQEINEFRTVLAMFELDTLTQGGDVMNFSPAQRK